MLEICLELKMEMNPECNTKLCNCLYIRNFFFLCEHMYRKEALRNFCHLPSWCYMYLHLIGQVDTCTVVALEAAGMWLS